ncbi:MAG TPA: ChbG/HpnK family deacetylase [Verrucomicrobiae bacterium]|nr:ChbG/HpnK family deacetylase [Verrucomicrobiae bacterium]
MQSKRLIINADDFGLSRGITDGILLAHNEGLLTSTSLMVNQSATDYAVSRLTSAPRLGCGIHLNLCQGRSVLPAKSVPSLVTPDGIFLSPSEMSRRLSTWRVSSDEVEAELRAQIQRMKSYGLTPTHADSHHRMHTWPAAVGPFHRAIRKEGIVRARSPRKRYWPETAGLAGPYAGPLLRRVAVKAYLEFLHLITFRDVALPDAGVSLHPKFDRNTESLASAWKSTLEYLPSGTYEMWCHPGFWDPGFSETDKLAPQRECEIRVLTDPTLREIVSRKGIELIGFEQIPAPGA